MRKEFPAGLGEKRVAPGHICHFGNRNRGLDIAANVLAVGLHEGERCVLVADSKCKREILRRLELLAVDASKTSEGKLVHVSGQSTGMALLGCIVSHLEKQPEVRTRLVGCPVWDRAGWPVLDDLLAFEGLIDELAVRYQALYLCIYDPKVAPIHFTHAHPKIIQENQVVDNSAYVPPSEFRRYLRRRAEIG
ncbi:MAG: MEDS domain-containing protein [Terriglobales bacterium]